jgi:CheY-like chemotaxis protein
MIDLTSKELLTIFLRDSKPYDRQSIATLFRSQTGIGVFSTGKGQTKVCDQVTSLIKQVRPNLEFVTVADALADPEKIIAQAETKMNFILGEELDPVDLLLSVLSKDTKDLFAKFLIASLIATPVKRICKQCARVSTASNDMLKQIPSFLQNELIRDYVFGRGCDACGHSSYKGTTFLLSSCYVTDKIRELLTRFPSDGEITAIAYSEGMRSLMQDGLEKIRRGETSYEEVLNVSKRPTEHFEKIINQLTIKHPTHTKQRLLIVEDDPDQRSILELLFQNEGYTTLAVKSGPRAISMLPSNNVDLVVCDLMMPGMNGEELVKYLRGSSNFSKLPILMLTAIDSAERESSLLESGADDYCPKTVKRKVLLARVKRLLERSSNPNPLHHLTQA